MFLITYILIQCIITMEFIIMIASFVNGLPTTTLRYMGWRFITNRGTAFVLDLTISCIIGWFTGEGMTSGFANLSSGIIVSVIAPYVLNWKFKYKTLESEYKTAKERNAANSPFMKSKAKFKRIKDFLSRKPGLA